MNDTTSPVTLHLPATLGVNIGAGESGAGGADNRTRSGSVPSLIAPDGKPVMRVCATGLVGGELVEGVVGVVAGVEGVVCPVGVAGVEVAGVV
ncbi:MAG: hypothetical protein WBQ21_00995 [Solirubrobacteraceae bacterium]